MRWPHPILAFRRSLQADVRAELEPIIRTAAVREAQAAVADLAPLLAAISEQVVASQEAILELQRATLDKLVAVTGAIAARLDLESERSAASHDRLFVALETTAADTATRVEQQSRAAFDRVLSHPSYHTGALIGSWMAGRAGEAVRYAVRKSSMDPTQTDNATRRREALEWARRWLHDHGEPVPPDVVVNTMIEIAVLEMKYSQASARAV